MNSRSNAASAPDISASSADPRWELVVRISESQRFAKSARLRDFLLYVCRAARDNHLSEISEQKIGERVFHRPPDYNPNEDNIVRSQARLLRQKLDAYFATEGAEEPLTLQIPKGGYVPEFIERTPEPAAQANVVQPSVIQPISLAPAASRHNLIAWLALAVGILSFSVGVLVVMLVRSRPQAQGTDSPALNALWSQLFSDKATTTIVVPDHTFAMLQEASGVRDNLEDYLRRSVPGSDGDAPAGRNLESLLPRFAERRYTTYDGVSTAVRILDLAQKFPSRVVVRYARDITLRDLSSGNAILIGRPATNLWTELFEPRLNFHFYSDLHNHQVICKNAAPQPGEPAEFTPKAENGRFEEYSSVAFLDNLSGGNVLLIGGAASTSQEGAADFVTSDKLLGALAAKIAHKGRMPYFDALLRTVTVDGISQEPSLAAYRVLGAR